ncbi:MAG: hypothetical protein IKM28_02820 [Lachnospiraceae bacterium]|nr:hypothetical protein [Lachnospiraceae bacterium]
MKTLKRIIYSLLGLLLFCTVVLVGFILYAEYSGQVFPSLPQNLLAGSEASQDASRLVYDKQGNPIELPEGVSPVATEAEEGTKAASSADSSSTSPAVSTDSASEAQPESATASSDSSALLDIEYHYIMDLGSNLFHYETCDYAANISDENYSARTAPREQIINAGYEACSYCRP